MAKAWAYSIALLVMASLAVGDSGWDNAFATFYGDIHGGETMSTTVTKGACGYRDLFEQGYGLDTAMLSTTLFNDGLTCGACYELQWVNN